MEVLESTDMISLHSDGLMLSSLPTLTGNRAEIAHIVWDFQRTFLTLGICQQQDSYNEQTKRFVFA